MKKKIRIVQFFFTVFLLTTFSCSKVSKNININEFNKAIKDSLTPIENVSYTSYIIRIKGHANDSSYIKPCDSCYKFYVSGDSIDEKLIFDYYGEFKVRFEFNPYKATEGKLDIEISIQ